MANARKQQTPKKESLEELQQKRTNYYFAMGDKTYHIKVLETEILQLTQNLSETNQKIKDLLKQRDQEEASKKMESTEQTVNA